MSSTGVHMCHHQSGASEHSLHLQWGLAECMQSLGTASKAHMYQHRRDSPALHEPTWAAATTMSAVPRIVQTRAGHLVATVLRPPMTPAGCEIGLENGILTNLQDPSVMRHWR